MTKHKPNPICELSKTATTTNNINNKLMATNPPMNLVLLLSFSAKIGISGPNMKLADIYGIGNQNDTAKSGNYLSKKENEFKTIKLNHS